MVVPLLLGPSGVSFKIGVPGREGDAMARGEVVPKHVLSEAGTIAVPIGPGGAVVVSGIDVISKCWFHLAAGRKFDGSNLLCFGNSSFPT